MILMYNNLMFGLLKNVTKRDIIKSITNLKQNYVDTDMILKRKKRKKWGEQEDVGDEESEQEEKEEGVEGERNNLKTLSHLELS